MSFDFLKLNPITKVLCSVILTFMQAFSETLCARAFLLLFTILIIFASRSKVKFKFKMFFYTVFVSFLVSLFCNSGNLIFEFGILKIYSGFLRYFAMTSMSMITFLITSMIFLNSISTKDIPHVVSFFLVPFKKMKIDTNEISMVVSLAMRFMPVVLEESKKIIVAQESRGACITSGSILKRVKCVFPMFIPVLLSCFRRAISVSLAMESRCYGAPFEKTTLYDNKFALIDIFWAILILLAFFGVIYCNYIKIF